MQRSYPIKTTSVNMFKNNIYFSLQGWKVYDSNPNNVKCPLICLPPVSGTADIFFQQILSLSAKGYRVISVSEF